MSIDADQGLLRAYDLIESDQLDEARGILEPLLKADPDNADAWWLYAHAVSDTNVARDALVNVQRIDPDYPEAAQLLQILEEQSHGRGITRLGEQEPSLLPPVPATLPGISSPDTDDDWDALDEDEEVIPLWRRPAFLLATGLIIFVIVAALVILRPPPSQSQVAPTSTTIAIDVTLTSDSSAGLVTGIPSEPPPTLESIDTSPEVTTGGEDTEYQGIYSALSGFSLPDNAITTEETALGATVIASICTQGGAELRTTLNEAMRSLAQENASAPVGSDALGARMMDCTSNTPMLVIATSVSDAANYANGTLSEEEFQARWLPVG